MSTAKNSQILSEQEYLLAEMHSDIRHEFINGNVYAMAGAGRNHRVLTGNLFSSIHEHLRGGPCEPSMGDARVEAAKNYLYPDIVVDCNESISPDSLYAEKPTLIVEVLSRSTRHLDRGEKLLSYINIPGLLEYAMVEQEFASIDVLRKSEGWVPRHYALGDEIHFESIDLTLPVTDIYTRVENPDVVEFLKSRS